MLLSNVYTLLKKSFRGRRQAHYVSYIAHFKLLLWSDNTVCGNSFNAVSQSRSTSTWPLNCAHIIIIHSAESPVIFHSHTVVSCPVVIHLVLQICLSVASTFLCEQFFSLMIRKKIFEISGWTDVNNVTSKNINFKSEINKVSTNKICQFVENIVPIN
jgi:hypothetical protein